MSERACDAVGIDLGTTYSSLAYMDAQLTPRIVCDGNGQAVTPSVIYFDEQEIIVGETALQQSKDHPDRLVQFIKVHMGDKWTREIGGHVHTPESLSAMILGHLIREAEPQIGAIRNAVITVPAYFTEKRRAATQQAGEIAGMNVLGTLNEPMAAMLAFGVHRTDKETTVLVYDLGGGTFDVTIVRVNSNELIELATNGNRQLGGRDWDQILIDHACRQFESRHKRDPRAEQEAIQTLRFECEKAKRNLSRLGKAPVRLTAFGLSHTEEITRELFESLTAHLLHATRLTCDMALEDAKLSWKQIDKVLLVGGSTHMPAVREMLRQASGRAPEHGVNPVLAVALGAAIYAHMLETGQKLRTIQQSLPRAAVLPPPVAVGFPDADTPVLLESAEESVIIPVTPLPTVKFVTAHGVGVRAKTPEGGFRNNVLIPKNTRVPAAVTRRFKTTGKAGATNAVNVCITQGDTPDVNLAEVLGIGCIQGIPSDAPGNPVDVTLSFDEQGRLHTEAVYVRTGQKMQMVIEVAGGLRPEEVEAHRQFFQATSFARPFDAATALNKLKDEDEGLDIIQPI